jgi:hypothetical protein
MWRQKLKNLIVTSLLDVGRVSLVGVNLHGRVMLSTTLASGAPTVKSCHQGSRREEEPANVLVQFLNHLCVAFYHSKAANTSPAIAALQGPHQCPAPPALHPTSVNITASAMKPANQKSIVRTSAARIPNLCAAVGYLAGARIR